MIFAWLNKRDWKRPGPIVTMAVQNAHSLANLGHETHLFVGAGEVASNIEDDLREFYGLEPVKALQVHRFERWRIGHSRLALPIYLRTSRAIRQLAQRGPIAVITRDATFLPLLARLRRRLKVRSNITVDLDDVLGQQVPHCLRWIRWHVRAEHVVEAPILPDYDDKVTDRRARIDNS